MTDVPCKDCHDLGSASGAGTLESVEELLAAGCNVNKPYEQNESALLRSCRTRHASVVKLLLASGADPTVASDIGLTPLHCLSCFDDEDIDRIGTLLHSRGANLEARVSFPGFHIFEDLATHGTM